MKFFTLCTLTLVVLVTLVSATDKSDPNKNHPAGIERGSDVEYLDSGNTRHPHNRRTHKPIHHKPTKHPIRKPTKRPKKKLVVSTPVINIDNDFSLEPENVTLPDIGNDTTTTDSSSSSSSSPNPFSNETTTTNNPLNNETTTSSTVDPYKPENCEIFSLNEGSFNHSLEYWKADLVKAYDTKRDAKFKETIHVRKCTYNDNSDFGFHIHYLLEVSGCPKIKDPHPLKDCNEYPKSVVRCRADLLPDQVHVRGCALDNLEKSNPSA